MNLERINTEVKRSKFLEEVEVVEAEEVEESISRNIEVNGKVLGLTEKVFEVTG